MSCCDNGGMNDADMLFLQRLASPGWQHPGFAPYWPILRRLRCLAGLPSGTGGRGGRVDSGAAGRRGLPPADVRPTAAGPEAPQSSVSPDAPDGADGLDVLSGWDTACWVDLFNELARWRGLRSAAGVPLRFVAGSDEGALDYEQRILRHGEIPCKLSPAGARHDFHNGLVWLRFPRLKACFNLLHCQTAARDEAGHGGHEAAWPVSSAAWSQQSAPGGNGERPSVPRSGRGHRRDALTLLDENGALWPAAPLHRVQALRERRWRSLFVDERQALLAGWPPVIIGHGLLEKLHRPYKSMTAKLLPCPAGWHGLDRGAAVQVQAMAADDSLRPASLLPMPVQGWPGWDAANADPTFYEDTQVFRTLRPGL